MPNHIQLLPDFGPQSQSIAEANRPCGTKTTVCSHTGQSENLVIGVLVELTGIEPVASWLQTRRSPS